MAPPSIRGRAGTGSGCLPAHSLASLLATRASNLSCVQGTNEVQPWSAVNSGSLTREGSIPCAGRAGQPGRAHTPRSTAPHLLPQLHLLVLECARDVHLGQDAEEEGACVLGKVLPAVRSKGSEVQALHAPLQHQRHHARTPVVAGHAHAVHIGLRARQVSGLIGGARSEGCAPPERQGTLRPLRRPLSSTHSPPSTGRCRRCCIPTPKKP